MAGESTTAATSRKSTNAYESACRRFFANQVSPALAACYACSHILQSSTHPCSQSAMAERPAEAQSVTQCLLGCQAFSSLARSTFTATCSAARPSQKRNCENAAYRPIRVSEATAKWPGSQPPLSAPHLPRHVQGCEDPGHQTVWEHQAALFC